MSETKIEQDNEAEKYKIFAFEKIIKILKSVFLYKRRLLIVEYKRHNVNDCSEKKNNEVNYIIEQQLYGGDTTIESKTRKEFFKYLNDEEVYEVKNFENAMWQYIKEDKEKTGAVRGRVQALDPKTGKWIKLK